MAKLLLRGLQCKRGVQEWEVLLQGSQSALASLLCGKLWAKRGLQARKLCLQVERPRAHPLAGLSEAKVQLRGAGLRKRSNVPQPHLWKNQVLRLHMQQAE